MKKYEKLFQTKSEELKQREAALKINEGDKWSENTKSTQLVKVRRERKTLSLINELLALLPEDTKLSKESADHIVNMTTLVSERQSAIQFTCAAGDKVQDLLKKYESMKNIMERMNKFLEKNNLEINWNAKEGPTIVAKAKTKK